MPNHFSQSPPPPHHAQPHFYGVHEDDLGILRMRDASHRPDTASFHTFDSLASSGDSASSHAENVLIVALGKGLVIYRIEKDKLDILGSLEGLRGNVVGAKILPCASRTDPFRTSRPLVVVIVHGPVLPTQVIPPPRPRTSQSQDTEFDASASILDAMNSGNTVVPPPVGQYQTSVEIYSLKDRSRIVTLFECPSVKMDMRFGEHVLQPPSPTGNLSIQARGRFIVLTSGDSGEVYIFDVHGDDPTDRSRTFRCLGKTWTSIPTRNGRNWSTSSTSSETESGQDSSPARALQSGLPIVSLSHRWLAIAPPLSSSRSTINGKINGLTAESKPPGLKSHTATLQPQVTCELDTPSEDSVFNKMARDVTQEVIKGAKWVGDQGMQAWKSYWSPAVDRAMHPPPTPPAYQAFPPTHAHDDPTRVHDQPSPVSILDLEKLSENQRMKADIALEPIATFALPNGCSFVSFNPSGLTLLTASAKGDVQYVWDLMRMVYGKVDGHSIKDDPAHKRGPSVRQITSFTRMTVASIVDVVWTPPHGERLAIITDRGTVHVFDLPANAFQWPPLRGAARSTSSSRPPGDRSEPDLIASSSGAGALSAAVNIVSGKTQPLLAAIRGRPPSVGSSIAGFGSLNFTASAGAKGGKAVAAGFSKSVGAATETVNTLRRLGENRLHIPGSLLEIVPGCARWMTGKETGLIAVVGSGVVQIHDVRQSAHAKAGKRRPSIVRGKTVQMSLPEILPIVESSAPADESVATRTVAHGHWPVPLSSNQTKKSFGGNHAYPLSYAEINTSASYPAFHTDHRVGYQIYEYADGDESGPYHSHGSAWTFGEEIPHTIIKTGTVDPDDLTGSAEPGTGSHGVGGAGDPHDIDHQIVVTSRRKHSRKGQAGKMEADESEIFEDDCDFVDFAEDRV